MEHRSTVGRGRRLLVLLAFIVIGLAVIIAGLVTDRSSLVALGGGITGIGASVVIFWDLLRNGPRT